jgi:hypothetical protein
MLLLADVLAVVGTEPTWRSARRRTVDAIQVIARGMPRETVVGEVDRDKRPGRRPRRSRG